MDWFKKETAETTAEALESEVQRLAQTYQTNTILTKVTRPQIGEKYRLEVWVNLNSSAHLINIYLLN